MTAASAPATDLRPEVAEVVARAVGAIRTHLAECEAAQDVTPAAAEALSRSGYTRLTVPAEFGGLGADLRTFARAQTEVGRAGASLALVLAMHAHVTGSAFAGRTLPPALLDAVAAAGRRGELLNALASEPELGSPSRGGAFRTRAEVVDGRLLVTGRKTWSTGARALRWALVTAGGPDGETARYWIDLRGPGVRIEPTWQGALALRGSGSHDLVFGGAPPLLHAPPSGSSPAGAAWFWTAITATYLGVGEAARDALIAYAQARVPTALGRPIATLERVQETVGRIGTELLAARELLLAAAGAWDARPDAVALPLLGAAKAHATNAAVSATDQALRAAGGGALTGALDLERLFRDARAGLTHPPADAGAYASYGASLLGVDGAGPGRGSP